MITNKDDQGAIIKETNNRAHRNYRRNFTQIRQQYYEKLMAK